MRIGVLGTGTVGQTLASKLVELGHEVVMGSRDAGNANAAAWAAQAGPAASSGTFADAAAGSDLLINATAGVHSLDALRSCGPANLAGKVLLDVANPLDFSAGFPPRIDPCGGDSLGEQIQREFPELRVVKTLNTINCDVMVNPAVGGGGNVFVGGNDDEAKQQARDLLRSFGWPDADIVNLGDITTSRGAEAYVLFWLRLMQAQGTGHFNVRLVRGA